MLSMHNLQTIFTHRFLAQERIVRVTFEKGGSGQARTNFLGIRSISSFGRFQCKKLSTIP